VNQDSPEVLRRVHEGLDLVRVIAHEVARTMGRLADMDDAIACGREGLLEAARKYEAHVGMPFQTFAKPIIRNTTIDGMRKLCALSRRKHQQLQGTIGAAEREQRDPVRLRDKHLAGLAAAQEQRLVPHRALDTLGEPVAVSLKTTPEDATVRGQEYERLERELQCLPADEAFLMRGHYLEGVPVEQLAVQLGLSRAAAFLLRDKARERLQKRLGKLR
jgi:RNA polymerase sigma factor FliA